MTRVNGSWISPRCNSKTSLGLTPRSALPLAGLRVRVGVARPGPTQPAISGCLADKDSIRQGRKTAPCLTISGSGCPVLLITPEVLLLGRSQVSGSGRAVPILVIRAAYMALRARQRQETYQAVAGRQRQLPTPVGMCGCSGDRATTPPATWVCLATSGSI